MLTNLKAGGNKKVGIIIFYDLAPSCQETIQRFLHNSPSFVRKRLVLTTLTNEDLQVTLKFCRNFLNIVLKIYFVETAVFKCGIRF